MDKVLELFGTISLDTSEYEKGIKDSGKQAETFSKKLDSTGKSSDAAGKKIEGVGSSADKAGSDIKSTGTAAGDMGTKLDAAGKAADNMGKDLTSSADSADKASTKLDAAGKAADSIGDSADDVGKTADAIEDYSDAATTAENKVKVLAAQLDAAERNVDDLTQAFNESVAKTGAQSEASQELAQKLNAAEREFASLSDEMDNVSGKASNAGNSLDNGLGKFFKGGVLLQAADQLSKVADKITELGSYAMDAYTNIDAAVRKVNGYFAETGTAAESSANVIKSVYEKGVGDSLDSVAQALIVVKRNLGDLDDKTLNNITSQAVQLEDVFGIDLSESMRGVKSLMTQFGLSADDAMDLLVAGTQNGLDKTDELGDNLSEYAGKFAQAGYSASEYFQLLNNGLDNGAYNLDKVNDAINEVTNRLADGTIGDAIDGYSTRTQELFDAWQNGGATQKEVIDSIVSDIQNCDNQQQALNLSTTAFGTLAEDGSLKFIEALSSVGTTYDNVKGSADNMFNSTLSQSQQLEANTRQLQDAFSPLGDKLSEFANTVLPLVTQAIETISNAFSNLPSPVQDIIVAVGLAVTAFTALAPIIATVAVAFSLLGTTIATVAAPVAIVIAAITAAIVIFKNWGTISEWLKGKFGEFTDFVGGIGETIANAFSSVASTVGSVFQTIGNAVQVGMMLIGEVISAAAQILLLPFEFIWQNFGEQITSFFSGAAETIQGAFSTISGLFSAGWNQVASVTSSLLAPIVAKVSDIFRTISTTISNVWNGIKSTISNVISAVSSTVSSGFNTIKSTISSIGEGIKTAASAPFNAVKNTISNAINGAKNTVKSGLNAIKGFFDGLKLKLPSIKLPHFSISGSFSINPPSVPHFSVSWYKRAMNGAYLLDSPQLFMNGSSIAGGGEAGNEYIVGQQSLANTVRTQMDDAIAAGLETIENQLNVVIGHIAEGKNIYIDKDQLVGATVNAIDKKLGENRQRFRRGLA